MKYLQHQPSPNKKKIGLCLIPHVRICSFRSFVDFLLIAFFRGCISGCGKQIVTQPEWKYWDIYQMLNRESMFSYYFKELNWPVQKLGNIWICLACSHNWSNTKIRTKLCQNVLCWKSKPKEVILRYLRQGACCNWPAFCSPTHCPSQVQSWAALSTRLWYTKH